MRTAEQKEREKLQKLHKIYCKNCNTNLDVEETIIRDDHNQSCMYCGACIDFDPMEYY